MLDEREKIKLSTILFLSLKTAYFSKIFCKYFRFYLYL